MILSKAALEAGEITGWALDRQHTDDRLLIEAFLADRLIGVTTADRSNHGGRPETDGHAFRLPLHQKLPPEGIPGLTLVATSLAGERTTIPLSDALSPADQTAAGAIDRAPPPRGQSPVTISAPQGELQEPAWRRSGVDESQFPVFVLGAPRSGTTAVTQALLGLQQFDGVEEDHLLELVQGLTDIVDAHFAKLAETRRHYLAPEEIAKLHTLDRLVDAGAITAGIRGVFIDAIHGSFKSVHWVAKTPNATMIHAAPLLRQMWPRSRFIFMKRRAIENVASRTRKFHLEEFQDHCIAWADAMWSWSVVRRQLAGTAIELDQMLLAREPGRAATAIGAHLGLTADDIAALEMTFARDRPEQTSEAIDATLDPDDLEWSPEQMEEFETICGAMMAEFGYDYGSRYYLEGAEDRQLEAV